MLDLGKTGAEGTAAKEVQVDIELKADIEGNAGWEVRVEFELEFELEAQEFERWIDCKIRPKVGLYSKVDMNLALWTADLFTGRKGDSAW